MNHVTLYVTKWCGYCHAAEKLLKDHAISFEKHDITDNDQLRAELIAKTKHRTVPLIFVDGVFIGGFQELSQKIKAQPNSSHN